MSSDLVPRGGQIADIATAQAALDAIEYTGPESIVDVAQFQKGAMALAEIVRRAGHGEDEARIFARQAELKMGQMIVAARLAGDLAGEGRRSTMGAAHSSTLRDLGIQENLAADCVAFARLFDLNPKAWDEVVAEAPSRASLAKACRAALDKRDENARRRAAEEAALRQAQEEAFAALDALQAQPPAPVVVPLAPEEVSIAGAGAFLRVLVPDLDSDAKPENPTPPKDDSEAAKKVRLLYEAIQALEHQIEHTPPYVFAGPYWGPVYVMGGRQHIERLQAATTQWLRDLNALYEKETDR